MMAQTDHVANWAYLLAIQCQEKPIINKMFNSNHRRSPSIIHSDS